MEGKRSELLFTTYLVVKQSTSETTLLGETLWCFVELSILMRNIKESISQFYVLWKHEKEETKKIPWTFLLFRSYFGFYCVIMLDSRTCIDVGF